MSACASWPVSTCWCPGLLFAWSARTQHAGKAMPHQVYRKLLVPELGWPVGRVGQPTWTLGQRFRHAARHAPPELALKARRRLPWNLPHHQAPVAACSPPSRYLGRWSQGLWRVATFAADSSSRSCKAPVARSDKGGACEPLAGARQGASTSTLCLLIALMSVSPQVSNAEHCSSTARTVLRRFFVARAIARAPGLTRGAVQLVVHLGSCRWHSGVVVGDCLVVGQHACSLEVVRTVCPGLLEGTAEAMFPELMPECSHPGLRTMKQPTTDALDGKNPAAFCSLLQPLRLGQLCECSPVLAARPREHLVADFVATCC